MVVPLLDDPSGHPDVPAVVTVAGRRLSSPELVGAVEALAGRVAGMPVMAVEAAPTLETVVAVLAGFRAGVSVVPVAPDAGPLERDHVLRDSGAAVVVGSGDAAGGGEMRPERLEVDLHARPSGRWRPAPALAGSAGSVSSAGEPGPPALILYTSGTTGPPKGVAISRAAIAADLDALADAWGWTAEDTVAHGLPLFHVHGLVLGLLGTLRRGGRFVHVGSPTPAAYAAAAEAGATMLFGVPTVWGRVAAEPTAAAALRPVRLLVSGSAGLPSPVWEALQAHAGQGPIERYGMTETLITLSGRVDRPRRVGTVGTPVAGVAARLVGEDGGPVPADGETVGSLHVRGPTLMDGYLRRPDATAGSYTADGWFKTGDAATVDADGVHRIVGRESTELIKTGGYRVGAGEVESALLGHPAVREAAVVGVPDDDLGQVIVAYVVVGDAIRPDELIAWVAGRIAAHKRPRRVVLVEGLPRNAMGKVRKDRLGAGAGLG